MKKILVCDDDEGILEVIKIILEDNKYLVRVLENCKAIYKKVLEYKPDLIFLDIWMPGINGKEVTKILKREPLTSKIPIIIVSALNDTKKIATEIGADGYLEKPFDMDELLGVVKRYVN